MEQLVCLFRRRPRIRNALDSLQETVSGETGEWIRRERGTDGGKTETAVFFARLEERFPLPVLRRLHRFLLQAEELGGDPGPGLDLLLQQTRHFGEAEELFALARDGIRRKLELAAALSLLIGCAAARMVPAQVSPIGRPAGDVLGAAYLILLAVFFASLQFRFAGERPGREAMSEEECARCRRVLGESGAGFSARRLFEASFCLLLAALAHFLGSAWGTAAAVFLLVWQLTVPLRRRRKALGKLREEAMRRFPEWLANLALRLQTQTVVTALSDIGRDSCPLMRSYLKDLLRDIGEDPVGPEPYRHFMEELELPEIRETMVLLYALGGVSRSYAREQLEAVIRRDEELLRRREEAERRGEESREGLRIVLPLGLTVLKLAGDMILVLAAFLGQMRLPG